MKKNPKNLSQQKLINLTMILNWTKTIKTSSKSQGSKEKGCWRSHQSTQKNSKKRNRMTMMTTWTMTAIFKMMTWSQPLGTKTLTRPRTSSARMCSPRTRPRHPNTLSACTSKATTSSNPRVCARQTLMHRWSPKAKYPKDCSWSINSTPRLSMMCSRMRTPPK